MICADQQGIAAFAFQQAVQSEEAACQIVEPRCRNELLTQANQCGGVHVVQTQFKIQD